MIFIHNLSTGHRFFQKNDKTIVHGALEPLQKNGKVAGNDNRFFSIIPLQRQLEWQSRGVTAKELFTR